MLVLLLALAVVAWAACGALAYATNFAHMQREFPNLAYSDYRRDRLLSAAVGACGPIGLFATLVVSGAKHGLKWR